MKNALKLVDKNIDKVISGVLVVTVVLMLGLAVFGIGLRWFGRSFGWLDPMVRHLVFLSAFLGGALATGRNTHIGIEIIPKILENRGNEKALQVMRACIALISAVVLVWLTMASYDFFKIELEYGKEAFLGIHSGFLVGIIPLGFAILGIRFFINFFLLSMGEKIGEEA